MNVAVFVSGSGSNLQALIDAEKQGSLEGGEIVLVVSDQPEAFALKRAEKAQIETFVLEPKEFTTREEYDSNVATELEEKEIDLIVLAGFMRLLSEKFVDKYKNKILNIHPSLLPAFKGTHGIKDAFEAKVDKTGVTVHFVNKELDAGPIVLQKEVLIAKEDTVETLEKKIHVEEHKLYPEAVRLFLAGKLKIEDDEVRIID